MLFLQYNYLLIPEKAIKRKSLLSRGMESQTQRETGSLCKGGVACQSSKCPEGKKLMEKARGLTGGKAAAQAMGSC